MYMFKLYNLENQNQEQNDKEFCLSLEKVKSVFQWKMFDFYLERDAHSLFQYVLSPASFPYFLCQYIQTRCCHWFPPWNSFVKAQKYPNINSCWLFAVISSNGSRIFTTLSDGCPQKMSLVSMMLRNHLQRLGVPWLSHTSNITISYI